MARWLKVVIVAGVLAALGFAVSTALDRRDARVANAATLAERAQWEDRDAKAQLEAAIESRRLADQQEESNREAQRFQERSASAVAADRADRDRVYDARAAATEERRARNPGAVAACPAAEADVDLYAHLSRGTDEAAGELAAEAEAYRAAGEACEREHSAARASVNRKAAP